MNSGARKKNPANAGIDYRLGNGSEHDNGKCLYMREISFTRRFFLSVAFHSNFPGIRQCLNGFRKRVRDLFHIHRGIHHLTTSGTSWKRLKFFE